LGLYVNTWHVIRKEAKHKKLWTYCNNLHVSGANECSINDQFKKKKNLKIESKNLIKLKGLQT